VLISGTAALLILAACGESSPAADQTTGSIAPTTTPATSPATSSPATSAPPTSSPSTSSAAASAGAQQYGHPTGADEAVVEITYEGGFTTPEMTFARAPLLLITGDGRAISEGPVPAIYPGPLLPNLTERTITEDGIQTLLAKADELGLLADTAYARNDQIADAPDTVVKIAVDGTTYTHSAYALGFEGETDAGRANLFEFVSAATDLAGTVGELELGTEAPLASDAYLVRATPLDPATVTTEVPATIVDWPADASVRLADAAECAELPTADGAPLFADANQLTFFAEGGVTYQVAATPAVPGRSC
jgi:hypothetical protein